MYDLLDSNPQFFSHCSFFLINQHLDIGCIEGLADALSGWGGKDGSIVVISHDREFCDKVGFTHVGTVMNGKLLLEQRELRDSDWDQYDIGAANSKLA